MNEEEYFSISKSQLESLGQELPACVAETIVTEVKSHPTHMTAPNEILKSPVYGIPFKLDKSRAPAYYPTVPTSVASRSDMCAGMYIALEEVHTFLNYLIPGGVYDNDPGYSVTLRYVEILKHRLANGQGIHVSPTNGGVSSNEGWDV